MPSTRFLLLSFLCLLIAQLINGYDFIEQQIMDNNQLNNFFKPIDQQKLNYNYNSDYNKVYNYNNYDNYKTYNPYYKSNYNSNFNYNTNYRSNLNINYNKIKKPKIPNYRRPDYFTYQTIEQKPITKNNDDVQFKIDDVNQWDRMPIFIDRTVDKAMLDKAVVVNKTFDKPFDKAAVDKTIDQPMKKVLKEQRINKAKKVSSLRKYDEIRQLEKLRFRLQSNKVRVQELIEELKNLEYRCRRKHLYFFDTLWRNTANVLKVSEQEIDNQINRVDELLNDFTVVYNQVEKNKNDLKLQLMNFDNNGNLDGVDSNAIYANLGAKKVKPLSKEMIDGKLKEPRKLLDEVETISDKLMTTSRSRLDKIRIIVKDFRKEYKKKL